MTEQSVIEPYRIAGSAPDLRKSWTEARASRSLILTVGAWIVALVASCNCYEGCSSGEARSGCGLEHTRI